MIGKRANILISLEISYVTWPLLPASFRTETQRKILRTGARTEVETRWCTCFGSIAEGTDPDSIRPWAVCSDAAMLCEPNLCRANHPERGPPSAATPQQAAREALY